MVLDFPILSVLLLTPALGAAVVYLTGRDPENARIVALTISVVPLALSLIVLLDFLSPGLVGLRQYTAPGGTFTYRAFESASWLPQANVGYIVGVDELSAPLVFLTALLTVLALMINWEEHRRVREFYAMFLLLETTILGVFVSLDFFLFFLFWEVGLVPMYFIIAVWGGPRRRYAALKFFLFTFVASIPVLIGIFAFYFYGHTFNMVVLIEAARNGTLIPAGGIQNLLFIALLAGFGTKLPTWPLHTWLPDAHVEAPTGGSVILAGVLLKLGGYAIIRVNVQMLPQGSLEMYWIAAILGTVSILYGAFVCLVQDDLKRMVAFSSVSHMGFVTLGVAAGIVASQSPATVAGGLLGFGGAVFQMFAHGLVSAALFMVAGSIGHKTGTRNISELGGIASVTPKLSTFMMVSFLASLGLPGLVGFVAELAVFLGAYAAFGFLVLIPLITVVITTAYYIWAMQRAIFGPLNPRWKNLPDAHPHESIPMGVLTALFALFGILPVLLLNMTIQWAARVLGVG